MKILKLSAFICLLSILTMNCRKNNISDFDSNDTILEKKISNVDDFSKDEYKTTIIGNQIWMTENLNVSTFRNGDTIFHAKNNADWELAGKLHIPAYCYYDNDPSKGSAFGKLYNWFAVMDERGLAPEGFYIPDNEEYWILLKYYGMNHHSWTETREMVANKLKNGNNSFNAKLGGIRYDSGYFNLLTEGGNWWTSSFRYTEKSLNNVNIGNPSNLAIDKDFVSGPGAGFFGAGAGMSVRCLKGDLKRTLKIPVLESQFYEVDKNGVPREGEITFDYSSGYVTKNFVNGIENGNRLSYSRKGNLISEEMYQNGQLNGISIYYYDSNWKHKGEVGYYVNGMKDGEWTRYYWEPNPNKLGDFIMEIIEKRYYSNGKLINVIKE